HRGRIERLRDLGPDLGLVRDAHAPRRRVHLLDLGRRRRRGRGRRALPAAAAPEHDQRRASPDPRRPATSHRITTKRPIVCPAGESTVNRYTPDSASCPLRVTRSQGACPSPWLPSWSIRATKSPARVQILMVQRARGRPMKSMWRVSWSPITGGRSQAACALNGFGTTHTPDASERDRAWGTTALAKAVASGLSSLHEILRPSECGP